MIDVGFSASSSILFSHETLFDSRSQYILVNIIRQGEKRLIVPCNSVCLRIRKEELTYENRNMSNWERHEVLKISIMKNASISTVNWSNNIVNHTIIITKQSNSIGNKPYHWKKTKKYQVEQWTGKQIAENCFQCLYTFFKESVSHDRYTSKCDKKMKYWNNNTIH